MTQFGNDLIEAMTQAIAHARGDENGTVVHEVETEKVDVKAIRKKLGINQEQMAFVMRTSVSGVRKWEQGQRTPSGAAVALLTVMEKEPEAVKRALLEEHA